MTTTTFYCDECRQTKTHTDSLTTGYSKDRSGRTICFACCGKNDADDMKRNGKATLYFTGSEVSNWPGTLRFKVRSVRKGRHNMARVRYDFWFTAFGQNWHGYQVGDNTQIAHCRRIK